MKKTLFTFSIIAFCAYGASAQGISGGLKLGANFANQKFNLDGSAHTFDPRTSLHGGFFLTVMVSETFGVQPELLYNSVGSRFEFGGSDIISQMDYISVPVMVRYNPVKVFNIHAGPQLGFLMSAKSKYDGVSGDTKERYKGLDLGVGIGAGVDLPMGLGFSARYVLGLSNIDVRSDSEQDALRNNAVQIAVSYRLFGE